MLDKVSRWLKRATVIRRPPEEFELSKVDDDFLLFDSNSDVTVF